MIGCHGLIDYLSDGHPPVIFRASEDEVDFLTRCWRKGRGLARWFANFLCQLLEQLKGREPGISLKSPNKM